MSRYSPSISPEHMMTWSREQPSLVSLATLGWSCACAESPETASTRHRHRQSRDTRDLMLSVENIVSRAREQEANVNAFISQEDLHLYPVFI